MNWLFESHTYDSPKNGTIKLTGVLGRWRVLVDGFNETSVDVTTIWRNSVERVISDIPKHPRILMLGLGGGGAVPILHELMPHCEISAIEHDEVMVEIFDKLKLYEPYPPPKVIVGDAQDVIHSLDTTFDLILIDLFRGNQPPSFLKDEAFLTALRQVLTPQSVALMNVCSSTDVLDAAEKVFVRSKRWMDVANWLGAFWNS